MYGLVFYCTLTNYHKLNDFNLLVDSSVAQKFGTVCLGCYRCTTRLKLRPSSHPESKGKTLRIVGRIQVLWQKD